MKFFRRRTSNIALLILVLFLIVMVAFSFYLPILLTHHRHTNGQFCNVCRNIERITQYYFDSPNYFLLNGCFLASFFSLVVYCVFAFFLSRRGLSLVTLRVRMDN